MKRPYLWLRVEGPNGAPTPILGLIDTGADATVLPLAYATTLGYTESDLTLTQGQQVQGTMDLWAAKSPSKATVAVAGLPTVEFELRPLFISNSLSVLWGRADFMAAFEVTFAETAGELTLHPT